MRLHLRRIDHPKHQVRVGRPLTCAPHAFAFDRVGRLPNSRSVEHGDGIAAEIEMQFQHIARSSGEGRHDRSLAPSEAIEQGRLARVRRPRNGDAQPLAQPFALPCARLADFPGQRPNELERTRHHVLWHVLLVGKIDPGLDQR